MNFWHESINFSLSPLSHFPFVNTTVACQPTGAHKTVSYKTKASIRLYSKTWQTSQPHSKQYVCTCACTGFLQCHGHSHLELLPSSAWNTVNVTSCNTVLKSAVYAPRHLHLVASESLITNDDVLTNNTYATYPPCSKNVWTHSLLCRSQTFTVLSSLPETMSRPSGENLTQQHIPTNVPHIYICQLYLSLKLWVLNYGFEP